MARLHKNPRACLRSGMDAPPVALLTRWPSRNRRSGDEPHMKASLIDNRKTSAAVRREARSPGAKVIDNAILVCLFLFVIFAPHSIAATQTAWIVGLLLWVVRFAFYPQPTVHKTPLDYALMGFFILTGLAAFLSYEPMVSIGKLRAANLFTIVYLFAENIHSRRV